jgi:hypothetical protein
MLRKHVCIQYVKHFYFLCFSNLNCRLTFPSTQVNESYTYMSWVSAIHFVSKGYDVIRVERAKLLHFKLRCIYASSVPIGIFQWLVILVFLCRLQDSCYRKYGGNTGEFKICGLLMMNDKLPLPVLVAQCVDLGLLLKINTYCLYRSGGFVISAVT